MFSGRLQSRHIYTSKDPGSLYIAVAYACTFSNVAAMLQNTLGSSGLKGHLVHWSWPSGSLLLMQSKFLSLEFSVLETRRRKKKEKNISHGAKSGESGGCSITGICFAAKNCFTKRVVCAGALS